jgi:Tol biopolymer transport system component/tRNA A-37 threonylcarbamoyl transferase component Bud32
MTLAPGARLGVYEIVGPIGAGGMGTVYRARDTRLPRDAAIKVSAQKFGERFAREAHAIASLNHPNITTLYDVGPDYLVMELVDGLTLAERIAQGPLSLEEASTIARQIADALDYAHERGIIHRDLKPGNVKIRPDGVVKVLDFGLAKAAGARAATQSDDAPTIAVPQTDVGVIVGTAAYMAPEQVTGKEVDKRADIWAFGCVFYEMLTGRSAYQADTSQETMASILRDEVDLTKVPAQARRLLKRCLEKDPQKRLRHIGDVMSLLDEPVSGEASKMPTSVSGSRGNVRWPWATIAVVAIIAAGAALFVLAPWRSAATRGRPVRFEVAETEKMRFFYGGFMVVSPDGRWMVFPATGEDKVNRYWLRSLETVEARPLPGTEGAYVPAAWSWDSRYVIFSSLNGAKLQRVDIQGGPPQTLADIPASGGLNGATSNKAGEIVFASFATNPLFRVKAEGGQVVPVTALAPGESNHRWPQFLPDGRHFLYQRVSSDPNRMGVYVGSVDAKPDAQSLTRVIATNRQAYYAPPVGGGAGHLISLRGTTLMAQPFDPVRLELAGEPVPIAEGVESFALATGGLFSVSESGTLVYRVGPGPNVVPTWFDQQGKPAGTLAEPDDYANAVISPDGTRIAISRGEAGSRNLWVIEVASGTATQLTFDPADDDNPVWSPDGRNIAFSSTRTGQPKVYVKTADGSSEERLLADRPGIPTSWSTDSRILLVTSATPSTGDDIWAFSNPGRPAGEGEVRPVLTTSSVESQGQLSPDGRWLAYVSNESSTGDSVYVRPFATDGETGAAGAGARWLISGGEFGRFPRWHPDGKRLFYTGVSNSAVMVVDIDTSKGFRAGTQRRLVDVPPPLVPVGWSLTPDAERFLFITTPNGGRPTPFVVVLNWAAALKQ